MTDTKRFYVVPSSAWDDMKPWLVLDSEERGDLPDSHAIAGEYVTQEIAQEAAGELNEQAVVNPSYQASIGNPSEISE
jgi:hypothetical protein